MWFIIIDMLKIEILIKNDAVSQNHVIWHFSSKDITP